MSVTEEIKKIFVHGIFIHLVVHVLVQETCPEYHLISQNKNLIGTKFLSKKSNLSLKTKLLP